MPRYEGNCATNEDLDAMVVGGAGGPNCPAFTSLVAWLSAELRVLLELEEQVNAITSADDQASFCMEVSAFLKEMSQFKTFISHISIFYIISI